MLSLKDTVENFLFEEADLLDRWDLPAWEKLLTDDAEYMIPPIGVPGAEKMSNATSLFVIADDRAMIAARIERLSGKTAFCEQPRSNMRHLIGNVRILSDQDGVVKAKANVCVYRIRRADITPYIGQVYYDLVRSGSSFKIKRKTVALDIDVLRGQGGLGIIL